jgi:hypothetical protein
MLSARLAEILGSVLAFTGSTLGGIAAARAMVRRFPEVTVASALRRAQYLNALVPLAACLLVVEITFVAHGSVAWRAPLVIAYYFDALIQTTVLGILGFGFSLAITLAFRERHAKRMQLTLVGVLTLASVCSAQWNWSRPIVGQLGDSRRHGVVLQTHGASCGAATAANLLRLHGMRASEAQMAETLETTVRGTSTAQFVYGLRKLGLSCRRYEVPGDLAHLPPGTILYVDEVSGPESHAVLYARPEGDRFVVLNPLVGRELYDQAALLSIWHGRGIECTPRPSTTMPTSNDKSRLK